MKPIKNYFYKFMAGFYMDMRDLHQSNVISDPVKAVLYDMKKQRWESKIK